MSKTVIPSFRILLATARIKVHSQQGRFVTVCALIDQDFVATLITESLAQCLQLTKVRTFICITGIGKIQSAARHSAQIVISSVLCDKPTYRLTHLF